MKNIGYVERRIEYVVYAFISLLLTPIMLWVKTTVLQVEYIIPFALIGICGFFLTAKELFQQKRINLSFVDIGVMLWFLCLIISMLRTHIDIMDILNQTLYLSGFGIYLLFRKLFSRRGVWLFISMIIVTAFLQLLFSFCYQTKKFNSVLQFKGIFFNSAFLGEYFAIGIIALIVYLYFFSKMEKSVFLNNILNCVSILGIVILISVLFKIMSRASWLSLGGGVAFLFWARIKNNIICFMRYRLLLFLVLVLIGITFYHMYNIRPNSINGRVLIWNVSVKMLQDKPLWGYGFGGFRQNYMNFQGEYLDSIHTSSFSWIASDNTFVFNEFLKVLVEQGMIGILVIAILLYVLFFGCYDKTFFNEVRILKAMLFAVIIFGCFSYPSEVLPFHFLIIIPIAYLACISRSKYSFSFEYSRKIVLVILCFLWLGIGISVYKVYCFVQASWSFHTIVQNYSEREGDFTQLDDLYSELHGTVEYLAYYGEQLNQNKMYEQSVPILIQLGKCAPSSSQQIELGKAWEGLGEYFNAEVAWQKAARMVPVLIKPHYLLAKMYGRQKRYEEAVYQGRKVLRQRLKVYTPEIFYMKKEMNEILPIWERYSQIK